MNTYGDVLLEHLVSRRNVLAHEYFDVTEDSIYDLYLRIGAVSEFLEETAIVRTSGTAAMPAQTEDVNDMDDGSRGGR